jgi:ATP-dependent helicase HrpA
VAHDLPIIEQLKKLLTHCLLPDQVRIGQRLARALAAARSGQATRLPLERWLAEARASAETRRLRAGLVRHVSYPRELPITARQADIVAAIRAHPVVVVAGETGSGKTTQLPKMCLEAGLGARARIGCTQPRRVAALSISRRLAEELQVHWGHEVGCKIRFGDQTRPETSVKVMTDGILLAEIQGDPLLAEYEAIILDEAHERSLNIDFLLGYLKLLLQKRDDLKLIITSATIDTERFSRAFGGAPVIEVSGRLYPVEVRYSPLDEHAEEEGEVTYVDAAVNAVQSLLDESAAGDILVFMPGERDIRETSDLLRARHEDRLEVVPLFGRLTAEEQVRVFAPGRRRRVVVATNIAETSLTVPRIRYVVDTGLARISRYHPGTRSKRLPVEPIAQSSANQRKGRCGRVAEGLCVRLFSEAEFQGRRPFAEPEIQRCDLADVVLRMKAFRLGEIETFPFLDPPSPAAISSAYQLLQELGALDDERQLTSLGRELARLPVDPAIGRMILEARQENALPAVLVIAAGLSVQDPRERPLEQRQTAEAAHRRFQHPQSDFLTLLSIWDAYHDTWESLRTQNQLRRFCKAHFLSFVRMREWVDIHAQLEEVVHELGSGRHLSGATLEDEGRPEARAEGHGARLIHGGTRPKPEKGRRSPFDARYAAIHRSILTGLFGHVAQREEKNLYRLGGNKPAMVFPGSGLFEKLPVRNAVTGSAVGKQPHPQAAGRGQPQWLVAGELLETSRLFLRVGAAIDPEWVVELAPHLVKVTYENPHWDHQAGRVLCTEKVLLRGLVLRERFTGYLEVNSADATAIFIRSALIEGDLDSAAYPFLEYNRQMREKVEMWQTRLPHRVVPDLDEALFQFYAHHLKDVASIHDLNRILKAQRNPGFLRVDEAGLLGEHGQDFDRGAFPDTVAVAGHSVPVSYAYAPGDERDGVTIQLTVPLAEVVDVARLEWAVPALREERVAQLLDRLPKAWRRSLMPLSATAKEIVRAVPADSPSFLAAMSEFVGQRYGVHIPPTAWPESELPPHLRPRFELIGKSKKPLAVGRNLREVCQRVRHHETPAAAQAWEQAAQRWERYGLSAWDFGDLPERLLVTEAGEVPLHAWPGLQTEHDEVNLRLFRKPEEAERFTREAIPRLAERVLHREMGWLQKDLRALNKHALLLASLGPIEDLVEGAFQGLRRHLLPEPDPSPRTLTDFTAYLERARQRLPGLAQQVVERAGAILQKRHQALVCRQPLSSMRAEIDALVPAQFLRDTPFDQLAHLPRYLQALMVRAERAALNPAKETEKSARVAAYRQALRELRAKPVESRAVRELVERYRWLLEEFKVSVFAQELGTAVPVSAKKLDQALEEIKHTLSLSPAVGRA